MKTRNATTTVGGVNPRQVTSLSDHAGESTRTSSECEIRELEGE
jgi:hypothetical protein